MAGQKKKDVPEPMRKKGFLCREMEKEKNGFAVYI